MPNLIPFPPVKLPLNRTLSEVFERDIYLFTEISDLIEAGLLPAHSLPSSEPGPRRVLINMLLRPEVEKFPGLRVDIDGRICRIEQQQRSLEPCSDELASYPPELVAAVKKRLNAGQQPGNKGGNEHWPVFCHEVRKDCGHEAIKRDGKEVIDRGYGNKTIQRIVKLIKQNKQDK